MAKPTEQEPTVRPLLNISETAAKLGMSESWVRQQKHIPFVRIGRRKLFKQEDLTKFIERNTRGKVAH